MSKAHRYARRASDSHSSSKSLPKSADSLPAEIRRGLSPDPQGLELPTSCELLLGIEPWVLRKSNFLLLNA